GYATTDRVENVSLMSIGNHGYDNDAYSMRAVFISQRPFAESEGAQRKPRDGGICASAVSERRALQPRRATARRREMGIRDQRHQGILGSMD
ncbi:hypothetical protein EV363DRAFT_1322075, partial [Boletus edulis]